jgi:OOP family OmpA-OmpF porin
LKELAAFFAKRNDIRLVLVGHTDSVGALDFNIALSKRRAASVRMRLLDVYGLDASRIEAEGNGYLAPIKSNLDSAGRSANRRVEVVVLPLN